MVWLKLGGDLNESCFLFSLFKISNAWTQVISIPGHAGSCRKPFRGNVNLHFAISPLCPWYEGAKHGYIINFQNGFNTQGTVFSTCYRLCCLKICIDRVIQIVFLHLTSLLPLDTEAKTHEMKVPGGHVSPGLSGHLHFQGTIKPQRAGSAIKTDQDMTEGFPILLG